MGELRMVSSAATKKSPRAKKGIVPAEDRPALAEDRSADYLVRAVNDEGAEVWFYRVRVLGLHPRLFGPFSSKASAVDQFDGFLDKALQGLIDCSNEANSYGERGMEYIEPPAYLNQSGQ